MSQSHNYSWVDPNLHDGNRLCALRGHRPCTCAGLYLEPTRHFANSSIMNQSSTYHQPTIAPWYNSNWCQSDSLAQVPIPSSSQWNPSVGYNPADPLNMSIFGTGHSPMHDKSNLVAAIQFSPVQVYAPLGNTGYAQSEEQSIYYGSPAEQHVAQWVPWHHIFFAKVVHLLLTLTAGILNSLCRVTGVAPNTACSPTLNRSSIIWKRTILIRNTRHSQTRRKISNAIFHHLVHVLTPSPLS